MSSAGTALNRKEKAAATLMEKIANMMPVSAAGCGP